MSDKPNILLIVVDCLRADRVVDDTATAFTPNIDRLRKTGTVYSHLITSNSMTTPCMTSLFSGLYPHTNGVRAMRGTRIADDVPLLGELLSEAGYHTFAEVTGPLGTYLHLDRGFESYRHREGVSESFLGKWGRDFIAQVTGGTLPEPWFMYLHLWEVHMPRQVLPEYASEQFGKTKYDRAIASVDKRLGDLLNELDDRTVVLLTGDHGEKTADSGLETRIEGLKAPITHGLRRRMPRQLRVPYQKVLGSVRSGWFTLSGMLYRRGLLDNPLSSITGHGFHVYDSLVRVPLIVSGPVVSQPGLRIEQPVRQVDILPTILDLAGASDLIPAEVDGRSLKPLLNGDTLPSQPAFIETCQNPTEPSDLYGVRTAGWKLARHISDPNVPDELYDLAQDPDETHNLAAEMPAKVAELAQLLDEHLAKPRRAGVSLKADLSEEEMDVLANHLKNLGYVE